MTIIKRILSISAGLSLLLLLFGSSTLLGILTDRVEDALEYYLPAGNVGIALVVDNGSEDAIQIVPNQTTPLSINITNIGSKDCYVFVKMMIPEISGHPILSLTPTGNWMIIENQSSDGYATAVYQYVVDGEGKALEAGLDTPEMVSEARFYDFDTMVDFSGEMRIVAYAVQTDGFDGEMSASDIWTSVVTAVGE
ncbi:hypothetical protein [Butyrivibrio sp. AE2015]|uniref:hypothetical protein n=1 Tax=Butyrivibrio sp. AE2015 TaxID=1280663 RepID=UPI0003B66894|nr:hypothetical protein [Butyrivibrio sp. AE2015]